MYHCNLSANGFLICCVMFSLSHMYTQCIDGLCHTADTLVFPLHTYCWRKANYTRQNLLFCDPPSTPENDSVNLQKSKRPLYRTQDIARARGYSDVFTTQKYEWQRNECRNNANAYNVVHCCHLILLGLCPVTAMSVFRIS